MNTKLRKINIDSAEIYQMGIHVVHVGDDYGLLYINALGDVYTDIDDAYIVEDDNELDMYDIVDIFNTDIEYKEVNSITGVRNNLNQLYVSEGDGTLNIHVDDNYILNLDKPVVLLSNANLYYVPYSKDMVKSYINNDIRPIIKECHVINSKPIVVRLSGRYKVREITYDVFKHSNIEFMHDTVDNVTLLLRWYVLSELGRDIIRLQYDNEDNSIPIIQHQPIDVILGLGSHNGDRYYRCGPFWVKDNNATRPNISYTVDDTEVYENIGENGTLLVVQKKYRSKYSDYRDYVYDVSHTDGEVTYDDVVERIDDMMKHIDK